MRLKSLLALPQCAIYALVHHSKKRMFVHYSSNVVGHICKLVEDIKYRRLKDKHLLRYGDKYDIEILESFEIPKTEVDRALQKNLVNSIEKLYIEKGYDVIVPFNIPKFVIKVALQASGVFHIYAINKQGMRIVIGVFDNKEDCDTHLALVSVNNIVIANNELTKDYYKNLDLKC